MVELYNDGYGLVAIAELYDCSTTHVRNILLENGVQLRRKGVSSKIYDDDTVKDVVDYYKQGYSIKELRDMLGIGSVSIRKILTDNGVKIRGRGRGRINFSEEDCRKIVEMYNSKYTIESIANYYNVSINTIRRVLVERGVRIRKPSEIHRHNEEYIEQIRDLYSELGNYRKVAERLGTTKQNVYKLLKKYGKHSSS